MKKLQDRGTKAKRQTINHENTQDIKQQKAPPRNNPGSARSRIKINNEKIGMYLAFTGTIKDDVLQTEEIGFELLKTMIKNYMQNLIERYKLSEEQIKNITQNQELGENEKVLEIMNMIGKKRGAVISGEEINIEKVANILIDDFRSGRLGRITLEKLEGEEIGNI